MVMVMEAEGDLVDDVGVLVAMRTTPQSISPSTSAYFLPLEAYTIIDSCCVFTISTPRFVTFWGYTTFGHRIVL